jgi:hypothetical protein
MTLRLIPERFCGLPLTVFPECADKELNEAGLPADSPFFCGK